MYEINLHLQGTKLVCMNMVWEGARVLIDCSRPGTVRYIGPIAKKDGIYVGVELEKNEGKNDGSVEG